MAQPEQPYVVAVEFAVPGTTVVLPAGTEFTVAPGDDTWAPEALAEVDGVKDTTIAALKVVREAANRLSRAELTGRTVLSSWQALLDYCRSAMGRATVEEFRVFFLDRKNALIADERQQQGTVDQTAVYPREVVKRALELGASAIIIAHNHPSGDTTPSRGDIDMTRQIKEACEKLGIALHDHVIVSRSSTTSFKSLGLI